MKYNSATFWLVIGVYPIDSMKYAQKYIPTSAHVYGYMIHV